MPAVCGDEAGQSGSMETMSKCPFLVTGGGGFIGFHVAMRLLEEGTNLRARWIPSRPHVSHCRLRLPYGGVL